MKTFGLCKNQVFSNLSLLTVNQPLQHHPNENSHYFLSNKKRVTSIDKVGSYYFIWIDCCIVTLLTFKAPHAKQIQYEDYDHDRNII
jgi:hypothetical protein